MTCNVCLMSYFSVPHQDHPSCLSDFLNVQNRLGSWLYSDWWPVSYLDLDQLTIISNEKCHYHSLSPQYYSYISTPIDASHHRNFRSTVQVRIIMYDRRGFEQDYTLEKTTVGQDHYQILAITCHASFVTRRRIWNRTYFMGNTSFLCLLKSSDGWNSDTCFALEPTNVVAQVKRTSLRAHTQNWSDRSRARCPSMCHQSTLLLKARAWLRLNTSVCNKNLCQLHPLSWLRCSAILHRSGHFTLILAHPPLWRHHQRLHPNNHARHHWSARTLGIPRREHTIRFQSIDPSSGLRHHYEFVAHDARPCQRFRHQVGGILVRRWGIQVEIQPTPIFPGPWDALDPHPFWCSPNCSVQLALSWA